MNNAIYQNKNAIYNTDNNHIITLAIYTRDTNYPLDRQGNWHFVVSGTLHHKNIMLKCLKKRRAQELTASNRTSLIKHLISGWRDRLDACVKAKGKHIEHLL